MACQPCPRQLTWLQRASRQPQGQGGREKEKAQVFEPVRQHVVRAVKSGGAPFQPTSTTKPALVDWKLKLEKVETAMNPADVCTKASPGNRIRELCRLARGNVCCSEGDIGDDPDGGYLNRLDELCQRAATVSLKGRVDFTSFRVSS